MVAMLVLVVMAVPVVAVVRVRVAAVAVVRLVVRLVDVVAGSVTVAVRFHSGFQAAVLFPFKSSRWLKRSEPIYTSLQGGPSRLRPGLGRL